MNRIMSLPLIALLLAGAACTGSSNDSTSEELEFKGATGPPLLYVAVGASETVGIGADNPLREAWPQVLYSAALPQQTRFVNLGIPGATVADALRAEVPYALRLQPDIVTVWLNVNDIIAGVSPASYERNLDRLLTRLRAGGSTEVLVANTPPVEHLPAFRACLPHSPPGGPSCVTGRPLPRPRAIDSVVTRYNEAIARAAASSGATVVDLHALGVAAVRTNSYLRLVAEDGFHPSTAGHRAVADAFARMLELQEGG